MVRQAKRRGFRARMLGGRIVLAAGWGERAPRELRAWRERLGLSLIQAADALGVDRRTYIRWEERGPENPRLAALACAYLEEHTELIGDPRPAQGRPPKRERGMKFWRLTPIDTTHNDWRASDCKTPAIVRAPSERIARWAATLAFIRFTEVIPGRDSATCPWRYVDRVTAEIVDDDRFDLDGPVAVLEPHIVDERDAADIAAMGARMMVEMDHA